MLSWVLALVMLALVLLLVVLIMEETVRFESRSGGKECREARERGVLEDGGPAYQAAGVHEPRAGVVGGGRQAGETRTGHSRRQIAGWTLRGLRMVAAENGPRSLGQSGR